jgi:hypothetical protein
MLERLGLAAALLAVSISPLMAQPAGLTADCQGAWGRYSAAPAPKAFAAGARQGCGWQIRSGEFQTSAQIRAQALRQCAQFAGPSGGCRIVGESK